MKNEDAAAPEGAAENGRKHVLYIDYSLCIGCETCETVCRFLYSQPRVVMVRTVDGQMVPLYCKHCEHPHCARVCKYGALSVDKDGSVLLASMRCRECTTKNCVLGCPHGGIFAIAEGVAVTKCDLCRGRRKSGELPACVEMCPCGAIQYVERGAEESESEESRAARERVLAHVRPKKA